MRNSQTTGEGILAVAETVCNKYDITVRDVRLQRRKRQHIYPRQLIMYLSIHLIEATLEEIADYMGLSSINTIKYADQSVSERIKSCESVRSEIRSFARVIIHKLYNCNCE